jgi:hypothetical protein
MLAVDGICQNAILHFEYVAIFPERKEHFKEEHFVIHFSSLTNITLGLKSF